MQFIKKDALVEHLSIKGKIRLKQDSNQLDAIGFSLGQHIDLVQRGVFDVVGKLDENTWQGNTSLQLMLRDLKETI